MSKKLIIANWKMNPATVAEARTMVSKVKKAAAKLTHSEVVVCPPFPFIPACSSRTPVLNYEIGAQSVSAENGGAHTGEVSAAMLKDINVKYVIVGHSEQRALGDSDDMVSRRVKAVLERGLVPIVCVGENTRDENGVYLEVLKTQIKDSLAGIAKKYAGDIVLAYEPVWAIGGKEAMKPEEIYEASLFVKKIFADVFGSDSGLKLQVLYGGAVNRDNARNILMIGKVDGLLVGHESVNISGFIDLLKTVDEGV